MRDFPGDPVVDNLPSKAEDTMSSVPDPGAQIPHAMGQLNPSTATRESCVPQQRPSAVKILKNSNK